jgi:hypothetical protein
MATCVPINKTVPVAMSQILSTMKLFDVEASFYQWNELDQTQALIWRGYCSGLVESEFVDALPTATLAFAIRGGLSDTAYISDVVTPTAPAIGTTTYPNAPKDSLNKMIPVPMGRLYSGMLAADGGPNDAIFLGYGTRGAAGVPVDDHLDQLKVDVDFLVGHGLKAGVAPVGTTDDPSADSAFWAYIPEANTFGLIDAADFSLTNNTTVTRIRCKQEPTLFIALRPSGVGADMHSGITPNAYKILDDDTSNYVESTSTDYQWAFNIPPLNISGLRVISVGCVIDVEGNPAIGNRDIEFGVWNPFNTGAPGWWGNASKRHFVTINGTTEVRRREYAIVSKRYVANDAGANVGQQTRAEFSEGRFVGRDSGQTETPLQLLVSVTSASKDGVRLYGCGIYVKCQIQADRVRRAARIVMKRPKFDVRGRYEGKKYDHIIAVPEDVAFSGERRFDFLFCGVGIEDSAATDYDNFAVNVQLHRASAQLHHLFRKFHGDYVNTVPGTLGNFVDAKAEDVAGEKFLSPVFGPNESFTVQQAKEEYQKHHPVRVFWDDRRWQCVYDEMNPHSSRFYRSPSNVIKISARRDIVGPVRASMPTRQQLRNRAVLSYGQAYGTNRPANTYSYQHQLSKELFGNTEAVFRDESWVTPAELGVVPENAKFLARYLATKDARPRQTIVVPLSQAYYDLRKGNVLEFDTDMESRGIVSLAYRAGRIDYAHYRGNAVGELPNQADITTPEYLPAGTVTSETYFCSGGQQFPQLTFVKTAAGTYTTVANGWEYYNGSAWVALAGVVNADALKTAGTQTVSWTRPSPWLWKKADLTLNATSYGPGYWVRMKYEQSTVLLLGTGLTTFPAKWAGRLYEVIEVTRKPGEEGDYPYVDAVLQEVM